MIVYCCCSNPNPRKKTLWTELFFRKLDTYDFLLSIDISHFFLQSDFSVVGIRLSSFATPLLKEKEEETPVKTFKTQQHQQQNSLFASCNSRESWHGKVRLFLSWDSSLDEKTHTTHRCGCWLALCDKKKLDFFFHS